MNKIGVLEIIISGLMFHREMRIVILSLRAKTMIHHHIFIIELEEQM